ncbi:MAG TPA: enolase C-terminal domain-like protein [Ferrovibrio sp.]|uniref:enolase C-terminal domain-like protein n=1 Tax=Ferrovibrio sp. TaxID=1917215 RepID=UPI002ED5ACF5
MLDSVAARAFTVPTDAPEADGTLEWTATTIVVVQARCQGQVGLGYTYTDRAAAELINTKLAAIAANSDPMAPGRSWAAMVRAVRNLGRPGICAAAISAVDAALWDLKARLLDLPLAVLLGVLHQSVPIYGSGGFTSYSAEQLTQQLQGWAQSGIRQVKMKIGSHPEQDGERVRLAREAVGPEVALFVDANGAYDRKQALAQAEIFAAQNVTWFEEPVPSDDLDGLHLLRQQAPAGMDIAAGEYGYDVNYFRRMLHAGAVDVLQADATRCGGVTGFLQAAALADAFCIPLSAHTAPALHLPLCCAAARLRHLEYFHDHVRIERMIFDGAPVPDGGALKPDLSQPGFGLVLREADMEAFAV